MSNYCGIMFDMQNLKYMISSESVSLGMIPSMKSSILAEGIASPFFTTPFSLNFDGFKKKIFEALTCLARAVICGSLWHWQWKYFSCIIGFITVGVKWSLAAYFRVSPVLNMEPHVKRKPTN